MDFFNAALTHYIASHTSLESPLLRRINRDTHAHVLMPRMLSGHVQGRLLALLSRMIRPRCILEIGTFTGYSAICLAEGLRDGGKLITLDSNEELEDRVRGYFAEAEVQNRIDYRIGNALDILPTLTETLDMVFIDADKKNYLNYYQLVFDRVAPGGYILADNVLWSGKVLDENASKPDADTQAIMAFNDFVQADERVENTLLPVRDGLMIVRKKE